MESADGLGDPPGQLLRRQENGADQRPVLRGDGGVLRERQIHDGQALLLLFDRGERRRPDYSVDFRGSDKARHTHEIILWHIT